MEPVLVRACLTSSPARRAVSRLSPLLANVVPAESLGEPGRGTPTMLRLRVSPAQGNGGRMIVPAESYRIQVEPMKLASAHTGLAAEGCC